MNFLSNISFAIGKVVLGVLAFAGLTFNPVIKENVTLGAFNPGQAQQFSLAGSGITSSASSMTLTSFKFPDGTKITMSNLNSVIEFGTLEPGTSKEEQISFTGITQNGDGTASLTGLSRGISFYYPYAASTTLAMSHAGASKFVLSNTAKFYSQFAIKQNNETISGTWTYGSTTPPVYDAHPSFTSNTQIIDKKYADDLSFAGAPDASETVKGISQLATPTQLSIGATNGSTGARLVIPANSASSTYDGSAANKVVVTGATNQIDANYIATSSAYTFTGGNTFSTATTTVSSPLAIAATRTAPLSLNGVYYNFPSTQGAASTTAVNDGTGKIYWDNPDWQLLVSTTTSSAMATSTIPIASPRNDLKVIVESAGQSGGASFGMKFNNETSLNYGGVGYLNYSSALSGTTFIPFLNSSTTPFYLEVNISNTATSRKSVSWIGATKGGGTGGGLLSGWGVWNYTVGKINEIDLVADDTGSFKWNTGLRVSIYGSNN